MDWESTSIIQRTGEKLKKAKSKKKDLETQLTDIQEQFQTNQAEIEQLRTEINAKQILIETYSSNQALLAQVLEEKTRLETQLATKQEQFASLQNENQELVQRCYSYLSIIEAFRKKQEEVEELENNLEGTIFNKRAGIELRQKQKELAKLELRLEKVIEEEKPALIKKLKMDNEDWETEIEKLGERLNNILITEVEKQAQIIINVQNGNLNIGNTIGDNTNLSHTIQTNQEQTAQILQPYGIPGSSKNN